MKRLTIGFSLIWCAATPALHATSDLTRGMNAFEQRRWSDAMDAFLRVLERDPGNPRAHVYVTLIAKEMELKRRARLRDERLAVLERASKHMEENRLDPAPIQTAMADTALAEQRTREEKWRSRCEQARMQRDLGHLAAANDLVLQVLEENASFAPAQRELSDLQSRIRQALDAGSVSSIPERYALEGYYAYGQADYATALTAWRKARTLIEQSYAPSDVAHRLSVLRFTPYEKVADEHVQEGKRRAEQKALFDQGVALYQRGRFIPALDAFRQLAIRDPEYPQLGYYLVQTEAAAEKERAKKLGEAKQREMERALAQGLAQLEREDYVRAERSFESVLSLDPSHAQARSYLMMARAERRRRHDPKSAQLHYEAGLIAYASGKLDDAVREWRLAARMNPQHEKALNALSKVQKELALAKDAP